MLWGGNAGILCIIISLAANQKCQFHTLIGSLSVKSNWWCQSIKSGLLKLQTSDSYKRGGGGGEELCHLFCPGFPVESSTLSEKRCGCVWLLNVDRCTWMGGGGGGEHERSWKEYGLFIKFCIWVDEQRLVCACYSVCVCACVRACVRVCVWHG